MALEIVYVCFKALRKTKYISVYNRPLTGYEADSYSKRVGSFPKKWKAYDEEFLT